MEKFTILKSHDNISLIILLNQFTEDNKILDIQYSTTSSELRAPAAWKSKDVYRLVIEYSVFIKYTKL